MRIQNTMAHICVKSGKKNIPAVCFLVLTVLASLNIVFVPEANAQASAADRAQLQKEIEAILAGSPVTPAKDGPEVVEVDTPPLSLKRVQFASQKPAAEIGQPFITGATGLPLPRFVSLKSDQVNVRIGPGQDYEIDWQFIQKGLPVEITMEFENWRRIRDSEGEDGWVFHSLLSGERTALVRPWDQEKPGEELLLRDPSEVASPVAKVEPNVLVNISTCDRSWCRIEVEGYKGWMLKDRLWGVYPDEEVDG